MIIGLHGKAGSGKDTAGRILVENYGFTRLAFADKVRELTLAVRPDIAVIVENRGWEDAKRGSHVVRTALQDVGMAGRTILEEDLWVRQVEYKISGDVVITDVRFQNEVDMIVANGGTVIELVRPGHEDVHARGHVSEIPLSCDRRIVASSVFELESQLAQML